MGEFYGQLEVEFCYFWPPAESVARMKIETWAWF